MPQVRRVWQANMQVCGVDKAWRQLNREGVAVSGSGSRWLQLAAR